jgi:hypothetical protein
MLRANLQGSSLPLKISSGLFESLPGLLIANSHRHLTIPLCPVSQFAGLTLRCTHIRLLGTAAS